MTLLADVLDPAELAEAVETGHVLMGKIDTPAIVA